MTRRYGLILSILLTALLSVPAYSLMDGSDVTGAVPPSRYGFTLDFRSVADPAPECLSVATGNFDKTNNDDIAVGMQDQIMVLKNNGGSGPSLGFTLYKTISLTGNYITDMEAVDYDADGDADIIALGQQYYYMANDLTSTQGPTIGTLTVYYIENTGTSLTLEASAQLTGVHYVNLAWIYFDGKLDLTTGDFDNDGDIDSVVVYALDTNGNANNIENIRLTRISYNAGSLGTSTLVDEPLNGLNVAWGFVKAADMDEDGSTDLVFFVTGNPATVYISWNNGLGLTAPTSIGSLEMSGSGNPALPSALTVAYVDGVTWLDVILGSHLDEDIYNRDGVVWVMKQKNDHTFEAPLSTYTVKGEHEFSFRGFAVGRMNESTTNHMDDIITFNKQDLGGEGDGVDGFIISALMSQTTSPKCLAPMKVYSTRDDEITTTHLNAIALGNLDGDAKDFDDVVYVGDDVIVGPLSWPPDYLPTKQTVVQSPSPVLNDGKQVATVNITVSDPDGNWDLAKAEVDFSGIAGLEGRLITVVRPTWEHPTDHDVASYVLTIIVPPEVAEGDYTVPIEVFGMADDAVKLATDFIFRVEQYNRPPVFNVSTPVININEDEEITFTDVYYWFMDPDWRDTIIIKIKNPKVEDSYLTILDNEMFRATLNMTGTDWTTLQMTVTPKPNMHHNPDGGGGSNKIILQAFDTRGLESEEVNLFVMINSVNDLARIPADANNDYAFSIKQDDKGFTQITGADPLDGDAEGRYLQYSLNYTDPEDASWLTCEPEGKVMWDPKNENVGPHKVFLVVNDSYDLFELPFWFNVSNVVDHPFLVSVSNATTTIDLIENPVKDRIEFIVYEHETFSLTVVADDLDRTIGLQEGVNFQCNLTLSGNTTQLVTGADNFSATLSFIAELKYGYPATVPPEYPPLDTEILVVDPLDPDYALRLPIRIRILNVNDPPLPVTIDSPVEGTDFPILYNHVFVAGSGMDPDNIYGDNLTYAWDFDASDGAFKEDLNGTSVTWDFPHAGSFTVTLRLIDSGGLFTEYTVNVTASGERNESDYDNDGIPNEKELEYGLNPYDPLDADLDKDGDHLSNYVEFLNGTDPNVLDTDRDGVADDVDYDPLDKNIWDPPVNVEKWYDDPLNIILLALIIAVILIILITAVTVYIIRSRKKSQEEEEKRRLAEEMQKSMYEDQDLYKDLPALQKSPQLTPTQEPTLPPAPQGLDDIFGGAGVLPTAPAGPAPPGQQPPKQGGKSDDLTDLLG